MRGRPASTATKIVYSNMDAQVYVQQAIEILQIALEFMKQTNRIAEVRDGQTPRPS
jgi:hypothetical protein